MKKLIADMHMHTLVSGHAYAKWLPLQVKKI